MMQKEMMSSDEQATLRALQAKAKRIQRAHREDEKFLQRADERRDELLARWGLSMSGSKKPEWLKDTNNDGN